MHGAAETFNFIVEELLFDVFLNSKVLTGFVYCKIACDIFLFFMVFLKAVMAQLIRLDLFLQTYFSIFCVENCFVIFFFCNCAMHGAVETFNSIFKELIFDIFLNTNVLAEFVVYLILFEEYCEFGEGGRRKNEIW